MGRKAPPRSVHRGLGDVAKLATEANKSGQDARREREATEQPRAGYFDYRTGTRVPPVPRRPIPMVGFGHDPTIGSRQRKAAKAVSKTAPKRSPKKK